MEILLWLVPPAVVTCLAMAWVSWLGREGRGQVSRDEAIARLGAALERDRPRRRRRPGYAVSAPEPDRSSGVTVRRPPAADPPPAARVVRPAPPAATGGEGTRSTAPAPTRRPHQPQKHPRAS